MIPVLDYLSSVLVKGLVGKTIIDIASGNQHSLLLDAEGYTVYLLSIN